MSSPPEPDPERSRRGPLADHALAVEALGEYLVRLRQLEGRSDVTEGSLYPPLEKLLRRLGETVEAGAGGLDVVTLPRPDGVGAPDLRVATRGGRPVGYVEAKAPGCDLEAVAESEQLTRYREGYPNLLLTDGWEMRLFRHGRQVRALRLPRVLPAGLPEGDGDVSRDDSGPWNADGLWHDDGRGKTAPAPPGAVSDLLEAFLGFRRHPSRGPRALARQLAHKARLLRTGVEHLLQEDDRDSELRWLHRAARRVLLPDLSAGRFADLYAQTVTYGLFAARHWVPSEEGFDRRRAWGSLPSSLGLLRRLFHMVLVEDPPEELGWILDELVDTLAAEDPERLFRWQPEAREAGEGAHGDDGSVAEAEGGRGGDPVLHFYQTFLAAYDKERRERRGVYYTPRELVTYLVRSVEHLLGRDLGLERGFADESVDVLDPAAGTLTFVVEAVERAFHAFRQGYGEGVYPARLRDGLLQRFHAFELMIAPYAVGHLRMALLLEELGCPAESSFPLYLADALQMEEPEQRDDEAMTLLANDARKALEVKKARPPVAVVLGNPPWSGHSANRAPWIERSLKQGYELPDGRRDDGYYRVGGEPLKERNLKWLQDDYVKFLRLAQHRVDRAGRGIVAFVTNHGWLENPTFRGLRESLLGTFDRLYVLDLHGDSKKRSRAPDGSADGNVFDIRQGVAAVLLVKTGVCHQPGDARVYRHDLWGTGREKLQWLEDHGFEATPWRRVEPRPPGYFLVQRDADLEARWRTWRPLDEIFELGSVGVITSRDALVVDLDEGPLRQRIGSLRACPTAAAAQDFFDSQDPPVRSNRTWSRTAAWEALRRDEAWTERFEEYLFRPFDRRWVFYAPYLLERSRTEVMSHLLTDHGIPALVVPRQARRRPGAFVTQHPAGHKAVSAYDVSYVFPLFLQPPEGPLYAGGGLQPNLRGAFLRELRHACGPTAGSDPSPENLFAWIYALLHCPSYLDTYRRFLATGFPRIPSPRSRQALELLAEPGWELVELHLGRGPAEGRQGVRFEGEGSGRVGSRRRREEDHDPAAETLRINAEGQHLTAVRPGVWSYRIGDHRILASWLDARRGRRLTPEDVRHLCLTVKVIEKTLELEAEIDRRWGELLAAGEIPGG